MAFSGKGLFSGVAVQIHLVPTSEGEGIVFQRVDLPGSPTIPAHVDFVYETPRCTILKKGEATVQSVEHLLSALRAFEIDNVRIQIDGPELPSGDGSALCFVHLLQKGGVKTQEETICYYQLQEPLFWSEKGAQLIALPSKETRFSYTLSYPGHPLLQAQFYTFAMSGKNYVEEIASCRTFSLYEEVVPLLEKGVIKGGSLENGVVIRGKEVLNVEGPRFADTEMARHKILDLIGDISLIGFQLVAHFVAIRTGHYANTQFSKTDCSIFIKWGKMSQQNLNEMDIKTVLNCLPHRYPFLLVDRVLEMDLEKGRILCLKNVTINEPLFSRSFPKDPDYAWRFNFGSFSPNRGHFNV